MQCFRKSAYLMLWCTLCCGTHSWTHFVDSNTPQIVKMGQKTRSPRKCTFYNIIRCFIGHYSLYYHYTSCLRVIGGWHCVSESSHRCFAHKICQNGLKNMYQIWSQNYRIISIWDERRMTNLSTFYLMIFSEHFEAYACVLQFSNLLLNQKWPTQGLNWRKVKNKWFLGRIWQCCFVYETSLEMFTRCPTA